MLPGGAAGAWRGASTEGRCKISVGSRSPRRAVVRSTAVDEAPWPSGGEGGDAASSPSCWRRVKFGRVSGPSQPIRAIPPESNGRPRRWRARIGNRPDGTRPLDADTGEPYGRIDLAARSASAPEPRSSWPRSPDPQGWDAGSAVPATRSGRRSAAESSFLPGGAPWRS
jgi:hypothetical protein